MSRANPSKANPTRASRANRMRNPGDLQHHILRVLWQQGEATVAEVHKIVLPERRLALTTIATMLRKMEARELVSHRSEGRQFVYRAAVEEGEVQRNMVTDVVERVFAGDASAMVNHLLREGDFEPHDLQELRGMIAARERQLESDDDE